MNNINSIDFLLATSEWLKAKERVKELVKSSLDEVDFWGVQHKRNEDELVAAQNYEKTSLEQAVKVFETLLENQVHKEIIKIVNKQETPVVEGHPLY